VSKTVLLAVITATVIAGGVLYFAEKRSQFTSLESGIPEYPGSAAEADSFSVRLPAAQNAKPVSAVIYRTNDPSAKVISFYKEKLGGKTQVLERDQDGNASAVFRTDINGKSTIIMISSNKDEKTTEIVIGTYASPPAK
jgi:hypothetical protein